MKLIYLLFIFGIIYSRTVPNYVFDIWYNVEYKLSQDFYRDFTYYPFRLPVIAGDTFDVEIKVANDAFHDFSFTAFEYTYYPYDADVLDNGKGIARYVEGKGSRPDGQYTIYYYTFKVVQGTYFSINLELPNYEYKELYFRIDLTKYKYSNIKDLEFLTNYTIDTSIFGNNMIPKDYQIYIRLSSLSEDKMQIQLQTHELAYKNWAFDVSVCQFTKKPNESEVYYPRDTKVCNEHLNNVATERNKYYYDFQTASNISHITIRITNQMAELDYLHIYIYTEKGMKAYVIALIIVGVVLVIAAIIGGGVYGKRRLSTPDVSDSGPIKI